MDYPTMGLCLGAMAVVAPFVYRLLPQKGEKGVLKEPDLERLDARVKLYERLATVENNQKHLGQVCEGLRSDNGVIFKKIDDLKDLIIEQNKKEKSS